MNTKVIALGSNIVKNPIDGSDIFVFSGHFVDDLKRVPNDDNELIVLDKFFCKYTDNSSDIEIDGQFSYIFTSLSARPDIQTQFCMDAFKTLANRIINGQQSLSDTIKKILIKCLDTISDDKANILELIEKYALHDALKLNIVGNHL